MKQIHYHHHGTYTASSYNAIQSDTIHITLIEQTSVQNYKQKNITFQEQLVKQKQNKHSLPSLKVRFRIYIEWFYLEIFFTFMRNTKIDKNQEKKMFVY